MPGPGRCKDPDKLTPDARRLLELVQAYCLEQGIDFVLLETVRYKEVQLAYYAQNRYPTDNVNAIRDNAGLPPITPEENKRYATWTMNSRHLPNSSGLGRAFDFAIRKNGQLFDPKVDCDGDGIPDWKEIADFALVNGPTGTKAGYYFKDAKGRRLYDSGHLECSPGLA